MTTLRARDRVARLFDPGSFLEEFAANTPSVITGTGLIEGRPVAAVAHDADAPGAWGPLLVEKTTRLQELAAARRVPIAYLFDRASPQTKNGRLIFAQREGMGRVYFHMARLSGSAPQIGGLFGPSNSVRSFPPALCDLLAMRAGTTLSLSPAEVATSLTGHRTSAEELGGAAMHASVSGTVDEVLESDAALVDWMRALFTILPTHAGMLPPRAAPRPPRAPRVPLAELVPQGTTGPFAIHDLIHALVDEGTFVEGKRAYAREIVTGLARIDGRAVGVVANNAAHKGGILHASSCDKAVRFLSLCDAYNLPLLYLVDVPGFMVGAKSEREGIVRHAAKLFMATATLRVPKISVVVRKAHTAGLYAMCGPAFDPDAFLALPGTELSIVGKKMVEDSITTNSALKGLPPEERARQEEEIRLSYLTHTHPSRLARELIVSAIVPLDALRDELARRYARLVDAQVASPPRAAAPIWPM